jgi:hypothetical protein
MTSHVWITLNARLRPLDRGDRYEDPLREAIEAAVPGSQVSGGGTLLSAEREPLVSDIDLDVPGDAREVIGLVTGVLEAAGAPKGSQARLEAGETVPFGVTEGVAVYLNGTDLPAHVYASSDINDLITHCSNASVPKATCNRGGKAHGKRRSTCTAPPPHG